MSALSSAGWQGIHQPLLRIQAIEQDHGGFHDLKNKMMNIDLYDVIISVSANASTLAYDWIDQYWPQLPVGIEWYAVGPSSAQALLPLGMDIKLPEGNHTEGLLKLTGLQNMADKKVLILRGVGGRELLAQELTRRGAQVEYAELYERQNVDVSDGKLDTLVSTQQIHYAVITSGEMAMQLTNGLSTDNKAKLTLLLPSERIKNMILDAGFKQLHVAASLATDTIIKELDELN